ncbi:hypothetical protein HMPREF1552_01650 [Leptotrichia sp. oral taxon 879 str. F0557]|nr:hypothetical protein HMPREF1552_01650 [Leptotrichia sp. oral taxon 879 str. F0557]
MISEEFFSQKNNINFFIKIKGCKRFLNELKKYKIIMYYLNKLCYTIYYGDFVAVIEKL